ncbi:MAG: ribonuclease III [Candidatus Paceibacterota bacterium]
MIDSEEFEKKIGVSFKDKGLLKNAFVHRSYVNEHRDEVEAHNERLEFLGDAVLELVTTEFLYAKYPDKPEGELTSYRAGLVNTQTLSLAAKKLGMNDHLLLSKGEAKDTGRARQYILANTFEAFIGALYLDRGYDEAKKFIAEHLLPLTEEIVEKKLWLDAKSHFQEKAQEFESKTPSYKMLSESGPDHDRHFSVGVYLGSELVAEGGGKSKQEAEQEAARRGLELRSWI